MLHRFTALSFLILFLASCVPPNSLGPKDPLYVVTKPSKAKRTILASEVIALIKNGKLGSSWSTHGGPITLSFYGGLLVALYPSMDPAARKDILDAVAKAPNTILTGIE